MRFKGKLGGVVACIAANCNICAGLIQYGLGNFVESHVMLGCDQASAETTECVVALIKNLGGF